MNEVIALETEIMNALPRADAAEPGALWVRMAHDVLCNGWTEPGSRLDRLRTVAEALRPFA